VRKALFLIFPLIAGCFNDIGDPYSLAPATPFSSWTPRKGNTLISSRFCETLLPQSFGENDLNLSELIDIGLMNNPSTKQTWAMARTAAAELGIIASDHYPSINFASQFTRTRGSFGPTTVFSGQGDSGGSSGGSITTESGSLYTTVAGPDVELTYTLFDFGKRTSATTAAREALYFADWSHNQEIQTVIQMIMDDYYSYLYQLKAEISSKANLDNACASLDAANQRFALGLAALGDVAQARTQYLQAKINLTTQKKRVETSFSQLAVATMPDEVLAEPMLKNVDELVAIAQNQRQDLLAREADLRSKDAILLNAKRAIYPNLTTSLDIGKYWFNGGQQEDYHWVAELNLSFPIFHGLFYKNRVKRARSLREESSAKLMQTELAVIQTVTNAHVSVNTSALNLKDTEEYLKAAELEFDIALSSYKAGTKTILDVISAQSSLADARTKKAEAQRDWYSSLAELAHATGSLCQPKEKQKCCL
jgi:outer membrane protein